MMDGRVERMSAANEPRERSEPARRQARERVRESEGRSPSVITMRYRSVATVTFFGLLLFVGACHHNKPPVAKPTPPPVAPPAPTGAAKPTPPEAVPESTPIPAEPKMNEDTLASGD